MGMGADAFGGVDVNDDRLATAMADSSLDQL